VADGAYLYEQAYGGYVAGTPLDTLWLLGALILACAAWQPEGGPVVGEARSPVAIVAAPVLAGAIAIGVLAAGNVAGVGGLSVWLAVATLLAVLARLVVTLVENLRLTAANLELAHSDALTGLGNRRALFDDLQAALAQATEAAPQLLLLFDLNGFKAYNDTFGHPAGDALLARLARRLGERVGSQGRAYRLGGDEFCALFADARESAPRAAALVDALSERGEHFAVGACCGEALLGSEAQDAEGALRIADQRLYTQKMLSAGERRPASREWVGPIRERASRRSRPAAGTPPPAR
jgi:diguanylate cyclase (GGDEF)-like protein